MLNQTKFGGFNGKDKATPYRSLRPVRGKGQICRADRNADGAARQSDNPRAGRPLPQASYWTFPLYLLAENISVPAVVLDFPTWSEFVSELKNGYTHVGINFIVPNVLKAKRMAEHIRRFHPETRIILGGYGTIIPDLQEIVPHDALCKGEGVKWLRRYFGEDPERPVRHPVVHGPAYEFIYGLKTRPTGAILLPGVGCENGCSFCITSHQFDKQYIPLLPSGKDLFKACADIREKIRSSGFTIMDENFLKRPERAVELLKEMTKNKVAFVFDIFSSAEAIMRVGVDFLLRLGIRMIWIGVESKKSAFQKTHGIDMKELIEKLRSKGIIVNASAMLFQEHHDKESLKDDIDWVIGLGSDLVQFMNYTPLPTTTLYEKMKSQGMIKDIHYRHIHGQGELAYHHPFFPKAKDHFTYLKKAFRKKYLHDGPGILNMALTLIRGYRAALQDYQERQEQKLVWNPESLRYEQNGSARTDEFMLLRISKMKRMAMNIRPTLLAALVFSPDRGARKKALSTMKLFHDTLGKPSWKDRIVSAVLVATGMIEFARIQAARLFGKESVIRQPPSRRVFFHHEQDPASSIESLRA